MRAVSARARTFVSRRDKHVDERVTRLLVINIAPLDHRPRDYVVYIKVELHILKKL